MNEAGSALRAETPVTVDGQGLPLWLLLELTYRGREITFAQLCPIHTMIAMM